MVSQAGKLNRFDLVQQISFLACQFQRGAARQVEEQEKSENIFTRPCQKGKNQSEMKMKLSILQHPLFCRVPGNPKKANGNRFSRAMLNHFGTSRLSWTACAILDHFCHLKSKNLVSQHSPLKYWQQLF